MKKIYPALIAILLVVIVFSESESRKRYSYVGAKRCKKCHGSDAIGNQYAVWKKFRHSKSVDILSGDKALLIAKKVSVSSPQTDRKCLKCHTTGGGRVKHTMNEGVGCEACHGPGSKYHEPEIHVNYLDRKLGYKKAVRYGMYPILGNQLKNRERLCLHCHRSKRPCYPTTVKEIREQRLTIEVIDKLRLQRNGEFINFSHPLRR